MSFAVQPALKKAQEEAQSSDSRRKERAQTKIKEQADKIKKIEGEKLQLEQDLNNSTDSVRSLEGRLKEQEETIKALELQLRGTEDESKVLSQKIGKQAGLLLEGLLAQNKEAKQRAEELNKRIAEVSQFVIEGKTPLEGFYPTVDSFVDEERQKQTATLETLKSNTAATAEEIKLRKDLSDAQNELLTTNQLIDRHFLYLRDLKQVPEEIRNISQRLDDVQARFAELSAIDFLNVDKDSLATIKVKYNVAFTRLVEMSKTFDDLCRSERAKDLTVAVNKLADTVLSPIGDRDLEGYDFYTTAGKERTIAQLAELAKTDQERYIELRKEVSQKWNKIVQQISVLFCEANILLLTVNLLHPLINHHNEVEKLQSDLRKIRTTTPSTPNADNINLLAQTLKRGKASFLSALKTKLGLSAQYNSQIKLRESENDQKTLADRIKDEFAQIDKQTELASSQKNKATQEADVDVQLTTMHKNLQRKYEDFMKQINTLWTDIEKQGDAAAIELMRLEDGIANNGVFTTKIWYATKERTSKLVGLGIVPPYKDYWYNPEEGIKNMSTSQAPATDAVPQPV